MRTYSFNVIANDATGQRLKTGGDKFEVNVNGPATATSRIEDNNDGTYKVFFSLTQAGDYKISVQVGGGHISGSPFTVRCYEGKVRSEILP
jgi:tripartite motif-containing protein 45